MKRVSFSHYHQTVTLHSSQSVGIIKINCLKYVFKNILTYLNYVFAYNINL